MTPLRTIVAVMAAFMTLAETAAAGPFLVVDVRSGEVVSSASPSESWHPASLTKLMTALVAFDAIDAGIVTEDTAVVFSAHAAEAPPSKIGLKAGTSMPLGDALRVMLTRSMNDIAVAVAETVGGDEARFASLMNLKARQLGMRGTRFVNPSGLHDPDQVSTAEDLALLARHIIKSHPERMRLFSHAMTEYGGRPFKNTNGLIGHYDGALGMKTGYVCASGFNLVALAARPQGAYIAVVLGERSSRKREQSARSLLDLAFSGGLRPEGRLTSHSSGPSTAPDLRNYACGKTWKAANTPRAAKPKARTSTDAVASKWDIGGEF